LGVGDRIVQTGWCSDERVQDHLAAADLCVLPLRDHAVNWARWPNKIGEYMAAGRPTVCTRVGDVADVVEREGIGRVCAPDARSLASAILEVLASPAAEEMGRKARALAATRFAPAVSGRCLEEVYTVLQEARHGARGEKAADT
jgi:glycosyltransferase involved in cell wall biosynthesis